MNDDPIGYATLGDAQSDLWAPDDYDLVIVIEGEWE